MTHTPPIWTDERVAELKRHHETKLSASQIASRMLPLTRSAVLGKLQRLGLLGTGVSRPRLTNEEREQSRQKANAAKVERKRNQRRRQRGITMQEMFAAAPPFIGSLNIPFADLRTFRNHSPNQCRFIAAEPPGPDYLACGNETLMGESWCGNCKIIVFNRGQVTVATLVPQQEAA